MEDSRHGSCEGAGEEPEVTSGDAAVEDLIIGLDGLAHEMTAPGVRESIEETIDLLAAADDRGLVYSRVRRLQPSDAAQAFVGSVIFASPLLVEGGVFDIATHLLETRLLGLPLFLIANIAYLVLMTHALLAWTGRDQDEAAVWLGVVPVRLIMILGVSLLVAAVLMTVWGRVGDWIPLPEAIARITVLWTVGAIGAGLGDILSNSGDGDLHARVDAIAKPIETDIDDSVTDEALLAELHAQLASLETTVQTAEHKAVVGELRLQAAASTVGSRFGQKIQKYTSRDIAEAFVGSVIFAIPFLVEDGVFEVAEYFLAFRFGQFPVFFLLNAAFVLGMIWALVYWAGPQAVSVNRPLLGYIPRRLVGIAIVSFLTVGALMTLWGRVGWADATVTIARVSVVWTLAAFGAALGDILPGESSGADINDELADLMDLGGGP